MSNYSQQKLDHWQDWINVVLSAWLFVSPWAFGFIDTTAAAWNAWLFGVIGVGLAIAAMAKFAPWQEWAEVLLAVWLVASPWVLGFGTVSAPMWNFVVVGVLIAVFAIWELIEARGTGTHATA